LLAARTIGVATNIEEYVPTRTPIIMANAKLWIISPPRKKSAKRTTRVVTEVKIVLESVSFILLLNKDGRESIVFEPFIFSLILSKTIIVSFNEYPIIVNRAAMMGREKSRSRIEKTPTVIKTSWSKATIAPMAYLSRKNQKSARVTIKATAIKIAILTLNTDKK
jgi:hypothetical protein